MSTKRLLPLAVALLLMQPFCGLGQQTTGALQTFKFYIVPKDTFTRKNIAGAQVMMVYGSNIINGTTDSTGIFLTKRAFEDPWQFYAGKWGYVTRTVSEYIDSTTGVIFIKLIPGYYDDFLFANAWHTNSIKGIKWHRLQADTFKGSNLYPANIDTNVIGHNYMLAGTTHQPFDSGRLSLVSPFINVSKYNHPHVYFNYFASTTHPGMNNDSVALYTVSGADTGLLFKQKVADTAAIWYYNQVDLTSKLPADTGHLLFRAISHSGKMLAGLGKVFISGNTAGINAPQQSAVNNCDKHQVIWQAQSQAVFLNYNQSAHARVFNSAGQLMYNRLLPPASHINAATWPNGLYLIEIKTDVATCVLPWVLTH